MNARSRGTNGENGKGKLTMSTKLLKGGTPKTAVDKGANDVFALMMLLTGRSVPSDQLTIGCSGRRSHAAGEPGH